MRATRPLLRRIRTSYIRLADDPNPGPLPSINKPATQHTSFEAIAYEDTTMSNPPRRVTEANQGRLTTPTRGVHFPTSFNLYCLSLVHSQYYLGLHKEELLYRITTTRLRISLHRGLGTHDPRIGTLVRRTNI